MKKIMMVALVIGFCLVSQSVFAYNDWIMETDNHEAIFTGAWANSTARILYYGDDYRWSACSGSTGTVTATAKFLARTTVDVSGYYSVFARWVVDPNRSTAARYYIYKDDNDAAPLTYATTNQETLGGEWRYLGTFSFDTGNRPMVILQNNCVLEGNGANVIADAVRWVKENIDAGDTVDEAGMDWNKSTSSVVVASTSSSTPTELRNQSITCPKSGYVVASFTAELTYGGTGANIYGNVLYSLSTSTAFDNNNVQQISDKDNAYPDWKRAAMAIQRIDSCSAGATLTYRAFAYRGTTTDSGTYVWQPTLVLMYFPTRY